jgi:predicted RNase H-like HicB family nuclease
MRVFTELYIDELRILVADKDYKVDTYIYPAGDPDGDKDHQFVFCTIQFDGYANAYGIGETPEEALEDLQSVVMLMYEVAIDDLKTLDLESFCPSYQEQAEWWAKRWTYTKIYVPDEFADLDETDWERWEEWYRRYDPEHIKFEVTGEYTPKEENGNYTSASGRKTKLSWI